MDSAQLKNLIQLTDDMICNYANDFKTHVKALEPIFGIGTHNTQEYTNAYITTCCLEDYFKANCGCLIAVRELPIAYSVLNSVLSSAVDDVEDYKKYKKSFSNKSTFSVDAYFDVDIDIVSADKSINGQHIKYLFVEYKVSNVFKYLALAEDFIKYKIYTYKNEKNTAFVFVVFDKKEIYPTILKLKKPSYILLSRVINKAMFSKNDRVFIYIPRKGNDNLLFKETNRVSPKSMLRIQKTLNKINDLSEDVKNEDLVEGKCFKSTNNFYFSNIGALKNNVSTAKILVDNYYFFIEPLYDFLIHNGTIKSDVTIDKYSLSTLKKQFRDYEKIIFGLKKTRSLKDGLSSGYKSSLNVLTLINVLNKVYKADFTPSLPYFDSETENNAETIYYRDILERNTEITIKKSNAKAYRWMLDAAKNMLIFIVKLYEAVFVFDQNGEYEFSDEYELTRKTRRIQKLINELIKEVDFDNKINIFEDDIETKTASLFSHVYSMFAKEKDNK